MRILDRLAAVNWIQREYGGGKIGRVFDRRDQWVAASYLDDRDPDVLVLRLAQGKKEARLMNPGDSVRIDLRGISDLAEFRKQFRRVVARAE